MPLRLLRAHADEMPRIDARESMQWSTRIAVGSGKVRNGSQIMADWRRTAAVGERAAEQQSGLGVLALLSAANDYARERGELWEQRVARGDA